jgi:hypothetical protein
MHFHEAKSKVLPSRQLSMLHGGVGGTELAGMEDPIGMEALAERKAITMRKKLKLYCILEIRMESIKIDYIIYYIW